jgi:hypothetical protein
MAKKFTELEVNSILNDFLNKVQEHPEKLRNPITKDFYAEIFATGRVIR